MKLKNKTAAALAAAVMMALPAAAQDITVSIDGTPVAFDVPPAIMNDRTMVPMRAIFEALGAEVSWDGANSTAYGSMNGTEVSIRAGSSEMYRNGEAIALDQSAVIVNDRTLVPVRAVSEAFGCEVGWNGDNGLVYIYADGDAYFVPELVPYYKGSAYAVINDDEPYINEISQTSFEEYGELDHLGRCSEAYACLSLDTMPTEERGDISSVTPTGWVNERYDFVDGGYLYNRCHLIGFQLSAENANERNLITGTRYMNVEGMLPFENMTADYIDETGNHVMYRVTPDFRGDELVARGVLIEAESVEDNGSGLSFNVYCYNVQPGVEINYTDGTNFSVYTGDDYTEYNDPEDTAVETEQNTSYYILNTNSKKFHYPDCSGAARMSEKNKQEFYGSRDEITAMGYSPCGICDP